MKRTFLVLAVLGIILAAWSYAQNSTTDDEKVLITILSKILESQHYHDQPLDDEFSERVFKSYIDGLDYSKMYFIQSDIDTLRRFYHKLDDEIKNQQLTFYYAARRIIEKRTAEAESYSEKILNTPFDFSKDDLYESDSEKRSFSKNEMELEAYWRQYLKYLALNNFLGKLEKQREAQNSDSLEVEEIKTEAELEKDAREQVAKTMKDRFKRRNEVDEEDNFSFYVNAICSAFGPHSQYFPPQQKENFDLRMTGTLEGIGAVLTQEDGYIKISSIVTGSASWRQGELKAGDLVLKVAQGNGEPVDIVDAPMKEVLKLIRGKKGTEVRLTVQKPDGQITIIPIIRDVVVREETYAKSAVFERKDEGQKFGYIKLPSFYAKFGNQNGRNSSDDIKKELERLNSNEVDGIVLDLRDNGGGSLLDAVKMAGLFFERGPVVQVKNKANSSQPKFDVNSSVTYDGPLVILVNSFSASASEILAGAMKDYDRAVIVGSPATYGKGTVQTFIDMNRYVPLQIGLDKPFGSLKYTMQQFYRINGSSTQFKGVHSHIILPDLNAGHEIGEKELDYALPWDSISSLTYEKWDHFEYVVPDLRNKSAERVSESELFTAVQDQVEWMNGLREKSIVNLNMEVELQKRKERKERKDKITSLQKPNTNTDILSLQEFPNESDSLIEQKRNDWELQLAKDAYIEEAMNILSDMLPLSNFNKVVEGQKR